MRGLKLLVQKLNRILDMWIERIHGSDLADEKESILGTLRNEAFYKIALLFAVFALVPIIYGMILFFMEGLIVPGILQTLLYVVILLATVSKRISVATKRFVFIFCYYLLTLLLLLAVGPKGAGFVLLASTLAIAGILLSDEQSIGFFIVNIVIFMGITGLLYAGALSDYEIQAFRPTWSIIAITSQAAGLILLLIIRGIYVYLERQTKNLIDSKEVLAESEKHYRRLFSYSGVGISYYSFDYRVISFNRKAEEMLCHQTEACEGKLLEELFPRELAERFKKRIERMAFQEASLEAEDKMMINGQVKWYVNTYSRIANPNGEATGVQVVSLDVTKRKELEEKLTYSSHYDFLTGLYNRRRFEELLQEVDKLSNYPLTVIMADVNGLKLVNDSFGHKEGDRLLLGATKCIQAGCGEQGLVSRIGGDEFAVLLPQTTRQEAEGMIAEIRKSAIHETVANTSLSISFGYATKTEADESLDDVLVEAENRMYRRKIYESTSLRSKVIEVIMNSLYEKSQRELYHSRRVGWLSEQIARKMGFSQERGRMMQLAGLIHDIGKIGVDEKILNKAGRLTDEEWELMKNHPEAGWRILSSVHEFSEIAGYVLAHHERWDGKGYPRGLAGDLIPLEARIIAVADTYDAMTSKRSYREPMSPEDAVEEILRCSGSQFDPKVVEIFIQNRHTFSMNDGEDYSQNFAVMKKALENQHE